MINSGEGGSLLTVNGGIAAGTGNVEMLRFLKENGCDWDVQTYYHAIQNGHLEVVKWLKANGCPWEEQCFLSASSYCKTMPVPEAICREATNRIKN